MNSTKVILQYPENGDINMIADHSSSLLIPWHSHEEYEIIYIVRHSGKKFVGDTVSEFSPGDLSLIGRNLPHSFLNNSANFTKNDALGPSAILLQFPHNFFSDSQLQRSELSAVRNLLSKADRGLSFSFHDSAIAGDLLIQLYNVSGMERLLLFLKLMDFLGKAKFVPLASQDYLNEDADNQEVRLSKAFKFIARNFIGNISLTDVANHVKMNPAAFSRYFRQKTDKTLSDYLIGLRINHSRTLLMHSSLSINEISVESGFNNLSNYNRHFKKIVGKSPTQYRNSFVEVIGPKNLTG